VWTVRTGGLFLQPASRGAGTGKTREARETRLRLARGGRGVGWCSEEEEREQVAAAAAHFKLVVRPGQRAVGAASGGA
jgi:KaiC/GvpD/RAD55 family RecA-like ATPase